jgi:hypothetical protein
MNEIALRRPFKFSEGPCSWTDGKLDLPTRLELQAVPSTPACQLVEAPLDSL